MTRVDFKRTKFRKGQYVYLTRFDYRDSIESLDEREKWENYIFKVEDDGMCGNYLLRKAFNVNESDEKRFRYENAEDFVLVNMKRRSNITGCPVTTETRSRSEYKYVDPHQDEDLYGIETYIVKD